MRVVAFTLFCNGKTAEGASRDDFVIRKKKVRFLRVLFPLVGRFVVFRITIIQVQWYRGWCL